MAETLSPQSDDALNVRREREHVDRLDALDGIAALVHERRDLRRRPVDVARDVHDSGRRQAEQSRQHLGV